MQEDPLIGLADFESVTNFFGAPSLEVAQGEHCPLAGRQLTQEGILIITAQEILVDNASYPTEKIARNSHDYRPLGLGYANLGGLLMSSGISYDSDEGRAIFDRDPIPNGEGEQFLWPPFAVKPDPETQDTLTS